jgi:hypothetical protein
MKNILLVVVSIIFIEGAIEKTYSIPAFSRKYGFNCNMCHTAYPKLNDFGQRFRDNGYQIPGQEGMEKTVFEIPLPLALRTSPGLTTYSDSLGTTSGFRIFGLDMFAAGVLLKNISTLIVYTPRIDEPAMDYKGSSNGSNPSQLASLESANIVFSNIIQDALNLRVGRFEPSYQLFSPRRSLYLLQPYDIYSFTSASNNIGFGNNQLGIEVTGHFRNGFKYGAGFLNGTGPNPDNNMAKDIYVSLLKTFGKGDGQSAGQRIGLFGYYGWQPTSFIDSTVSPTGEINGKENKPFYRLGGSLSLNWKTLNLQALLMTGNDDKSFNLIDSTKDYQYTGGFVQLDWAGLLDNRLMISGLFNWIQPPTYDKSRTYKSISGLVRYYLGSWTAVNVAIHAEYTHRIFGSDNITSDNLFTLLVDFGF